MSSFDFHKGEGCDFDEVSLAASELGSVRHRTGCEVTTTKQQPKPAANHKKERSTKPTGRRVRGYFATSSISKFQNLC
jgi:hypothetical protein